MIAGSRIGRAIKLTGSINAGVLFERMAYWYRKTKVKRFGEWWVIMTAENWRDETGLTENQRKLAVTKLRAAGLIDTRRSPRFGDNRTWVTVFPNVLYESKAAQPAYHKLPDPEDLKKDLAEQAKGQEEGPSVKAPQASKTPSKKAGTEAHKAGVEGPKQTNSPGDKTSGKPPSKAPIKASQKGVQTNSPKAKKPTPRGPKNQLPIVWEIPLWDIPLWDTGVQAAPNAKGDPDLTQKQGKTIEEILASSEKTGVGPVPDKQPLKFIWMDRVSEVTQAYVPPLTVKQIGQLKQFDKRCPENRSREILKHVLSDWIGFVKKVETDAGVKSTPAVPKVEFLLKHVGVAVAFRDEAIKAPPKAKKAALPTAPFVQSTAQDAQTPEKLPPEAPEPASGAEAPEQPKSDHTGEDSKPESFDELQKILWGEDD